MIGVRLWQIAGWTMLHYFWVGAVLGVAALLLRRSMRSASPGVRYAAALGCFVVLCAAPIGIAAWVAQRMPSAEIASPENKKENDIPVVAANPMPPNVAMPATRGGDRSAFAEQEATSAPPSAVQPMPIPKKPSPTVENQKTLAAAFDPIAGCLPWLWVFGSPLTFLLTTFGLLGAERLRRASRPLEDDRIAEMCRRLTEAMRISRRIGVAVCDRIATPILVGVLRPMILLPAAMAGWTSQQLEMVLLHELAHVRRYDNLVNLAQRILESALFFHPMVWLISGWVRREREHCCDALVVLRTGRPHDYAEFLVTLAETFSTSLGGRSASRSRVASSFAERPLVGRVRRILKKEGPSMRVSSKAFGLASLAFLTFAVVLIGRFSLPSRAEDLRDLTAKKAPSAAVKKTPSTVTANKAAENLTSRIVDSNGVGIANATVAPCAQEGLVPTWKATTDAQGRYTVPPMMEPGVHHELIRIAASGFLAREILCMGNRPVPEITLQRAASSPARPQLTLKYRKGAIAIAISPDSRLLASSCWNVVRLTDIQTGRLVRIGAVSSTTPNALAFSPNGKLLLAGTSAGKVEVLETSTLVVEKVLPATQWSIYALAVSPDSATLACCAADGTVQLWDLKSAKKLRTFGVKGERMASLAFSPDGKLLAALNCGGRCNVWNVETGNLVASTDCLGADERTRVGFSRNGATLAIASYGVKIHLWNFVKDKQPTRVHVPDKLVGKPRINGFGFSPLEGRPMNAPLGDFAFGPSCISRDSRTAACVLENGSTAIWDIASRRVRKILPTRREHDTYGGGIRTVSLSPDGHLLAVVSGVGYIDVWQIDGAGKAAPIKQPIDADEWPGPWGPTLNGLQTRLILTPIRPSQEALLGQGGGGREIDQRQIPTAEDVWWQVSLQLRNRTKKKLSFVWPETRRSGAITITREDGQPVKYRVVPGDDPVTWSIPMSMEPAPDFPNIMTLNSILLGRNYEMSRLGKYRIQFPETKAASTLREPVTNPSLPASNVLEFVNGSAVAKQRLHEAGDILRWPAQTSYGRDEPPATTKPAADVPLAKTVHGKVVDEDGKPIAGADVWMMPAWNPAHRRPATHTTSDADGRFTVPVAIVSRQDLQRVGWPYPVGLLWAYAAGHQLNIAYGGNQIYGRDESDVVIQLKPAAKTTFVVLGPDGKPRAGALVEPEFVIATAHYGEPSEEVRAAVTPRTDAKGQAVFTALPRDALISIRVVTDDFGIQTQQLMGLGSIPADQPIRLRQAGRIVGHVTAAKPEWARGVRIILTTGSLRPFPRGSVPSMTTGFAEVESDEHGYFVVPAIAAGEACVNPVNVDENLSVLAEIPDFRHHAVYVHPGETTTLDIPLVPSVAVRGSVRAKDTGKPIPNSWIQVYYGVDPQNVMVSSDAQGNFVAPVLPGRIRLEVMVDNVNKPGEHIQYGDPQQVDVPENVKEFKTPPLELVPTKRIAGQLIDQHDRPVANRTVWVEAGGRAYGYAQSDAKGEFTLTRVPAPIDTAKAEYRVSDIAAAQSSGSANDATEPAKAKVIQASPLVLRVQRSAPVVPYQRSAIMELIGDQATPTLPLRPLGSNLTVDKNGIIWDRGKPVGIWGIKPSEIPSQRR